MMFLLLIAALLSAAVPANDSPDVAARETVAAAAGALSQDDAEKFLAQLSPELRVKLDRDIRGLLLGHEVTSSISPQSNEGDAKKRMLDLDWYIEIRAKGSELALERRRRNVKCTVELNAKGKWRITAIDPASILAPPQVR